MFEKFGEFDSYTEINVLAENLFNEGDIESIRALAEENGIDIELASMYVAGDLPELCDADTAASGKLDVELAAMKPAEIMLDWVAYIREESAKHRLMALAVRKKGKSLNGCIAKILQWSFANQYTVPQEIIKAAKVTAGRVTLGIPGHDTVCRLIKEYYLEAGK